jgi:hypothetical protein
MFDTARAFARGNLRGLSYSDDAWRVRLFMRTYGGDFDPETAAWFSSRIRHTQAEAALT